MILAVGGAAILVIWVAFKLEPDTGKPAKIEDHTIFGRVSVFPGYWVGEISEVANKVKIRGFFTDAEEIAGPTKDQEELYNKIFLRKAQLIEAALTDLEKNCFNEFDPAINREQVSFFEIHLRALEEGRFAFCFQVKDRQAKQGEKAILMVDFVEYEVNDAGLAD